MPNYGGDGSIQAGYDGGSTHEVTLQDLATWWGDAMRSNAVKMEAIENMLAGANGDLWDTGTILGETAATLGASGPLAAGISFLGMVGHNIYQAHLPSRYVNTLANLIAPLQPGALGPPDGYLPMALHDVSQIADDTGDMRPRVTTVAGQVEDMTEEGVYIGSEQWDYGYNRWFHTLKELYYPDDYGGYHLINIIDILDGLLGFLSTMAQTSQLEHPAVRYFRPSWGEYCDMTFWTAGRYYQPGTTEPKAIDPTKILPTDTVLTYLQRENTGWTWNTTGPWESYGGTGYVWGKPDAAPYKWYRCDLTNAELQELRKALLSDPVTPPVWPGLDNVTLGDGVELDQMVHVPGPMDGVLVVLADTPPGQTKFPSPSGYRFYKVGWVAFHDEDDQFETVQLMDFDTAVFCPKSMTQAAGCDVWCRPGTSGIITPWTAK
jgi:hypothetical protein